ncbi:MAG: hypothetical protein RIQ56_756 [Candidatus Parcubacteria bacterium]|jgi:hypothetical protein
MAARSWFPRPLIAFWAWFRRLVVSLGVGGTSFAIMLGIMILSVVHDREMEPIIAFAERSGEAIVRFVESLVKGSHWGQVAVNHLRQQVNMTHVVLSIPAIIIATIIVGIPLNWVLGGQRTWRQRLGISLVSIPTTIVLAVALFTCNAFYPDAYGALLRFAHTVWKLVLAELSTYGDTIPGARKLVNAARQGFSGHHYVIMAILTMITSFLVNALFNLILGKRKTR